MPEERGMEMDEYIKKETAYRAIMGERPEAREPSWFAELVLEIPAADVVEVVRKPVKGYDGYYEVDQFGRVFGLERIIKVNDNGRNYEKPIAGKQLKQSMHTKGYKTVSLTKDGKTKTLFVHRLVAEAFIPNVDNLPMVNHKDEDKTNNFVENLEWCTNDYNINYGTDRKRGKDDSEAAHGRSLFVRCDPGADGRAGSAGGRL